MRRHGFATKAARAWPLTALLLAVLLSAWAPRNVLALELTLEQHLLAEARTDADRIVSHRRSADASLLLHACFHEYLSMCEWPCHFSLLHRDS